MGNIAIRVKNISKQYRIGQKASYYTIRDAISNVARAPFNAIRNPNTDDSNYFWALKDLSFEVEKGEVIGIIGRNGAGKSTLLKILSKITEPTVGYAEIHGRIGSLLEVGTGFHPELTGRENIYLSGAIIGMRKTEIDRKFDEIVKFAETEKFLDMPLKHYSSGMQVRLGFSVAAHLETEILMIDEVLAVGDAEFQKKCMNKMQNISQEERTILFVSHNMGAIGKLCTRGIVLDKGNVKFIGDIFKSIDNYVENLNTDKAEIEYPYNPEKKIQIRSIRLLDDTGKPSTNLNWEKPFQTHIEYEIKEDMAGIHVGFMLDKVDGTPICHSADIDSAPGGVIYRKAGNYKSIVEFPGGILNSGTYQIRVAIARYGGAIYDYYEPFIFNLLDIGSFASLGANGMQRPGVIGMPLKWITEMLSNEKR